MSVLSRFATYLKSHMSAYLDRAENPAETLDYAYEQQLEQLQNLRRALADVVTNEKRVEAQKADAQTQMDTLTGQAQQALDANQEDLARQALERKQQIQEHLTTYDQQIEQLKAQQQQFVDMERRLTARVETFRTQKEMMKAEYGAARAQTEIEGSASGVTEEMADVNLAVQRAQDKIEQTQARAGAMDELIQSGALKEIGPAPQDTLDRQLGAVSDQAAVDRELAALKAQRQIAPAGHSESPSSTPSSGEAHGA